MRIDRAIDVPFRTQQFIVLTAQAGSFHKAARSLDIDVAVIARSIDRLERDLGAKIFERDRNRFAITPAGSLFVREIQEAITHVERAWDLARYHAQIERGPFRAGYSAFIHSRLIPVLETLNRSGPVPGHLSDGSLSGIETGVVLECDTTVQLIDRVLRGELHAAFGVFPIFGEDLWIKPVAREPFCLCVSKNHRLAKQPTVLARDMDGERVFFLPRAVHPGLYDSTLEYIESTGAKPVFREVLSLTHTMEIVAHNFGVALLPRFASRLSYTGVLFKPVTDKLLWIETVLFLRNDHRDDRARWFLDSVLSQLRNSPLEP
ncbi:MAG TPA: LysR substrate-binding domain-containing protein [Acidobacteriaceae bacterium]|nr:LysR substrate-binding domain-containing protein [Acidobacteriaceae bacterium]